MFENKTVKLTPAPQASAQVVALKPAPKKKSYADVARQHADTVIIPDTPPRKNIPRDHKDKTSWYQFTEEKKELRGKKHILSEHKKDDERGPDEFKISADWIFVKRGQSHIWSPCGPGASEFQRDFRVGRAVQIAEWTKSEWDFYEADEDRREKSVSWLCRAPRLKSSLTPHVLYQSATKLAESDIVVVYKPPNYVCNVPSNHSEGDMVNGDPDTCFVRYVREELQLPTRDDQEAYCGFAHRLDRDTSGPLVICGTREAREHMTDQFMYRTVQKSYVCLVHGAVCDPSGEIDTPLTKQHYCPDGSGYILPGNNRHVRLDVVNGKEANTSWTRLAVLHDEIGNGFTLLRVRIHTGRTHQIRVHLSEVLNHPIVGDYKYGYKHFMHTNWCQRMFLHAYHLRFPAPVGSKDDFIEVTCPLPDDLRAYLGFVAPLKYQKYCFFRAGEPEVVQHSLNYTLPESVALDPPSPLRGNRDRDQAEMFHKLASQLDMTTVDAEKGVDSTPHVLKVKRSGGGFGPFRSNPTRQADTMHVVETHGTVTLTPAALIPVPESDSDSSIDSESSLNSTGDQEEHIFNDRERLAKENFEKMKRARRPISPNPAHRPVSRRKSRKSRAAARAQ